MTHTRASSVSRYIGTRERLYVLKYNAIFKHINIPCWNFWMLLCLNSSISCSRLDSGSSTNTRPLLRSWYDVSAAAKFIMAGGSAAAGIEIQITSNQLNGKKVCRVCNYTAVVTNHAERCCRSAVSNNTIIYLSKEKLTAVEKKLRMHNETLKSLTIFKLFLW